MALVFLQVESRDLDRRQLVDPEGVLALPLFIGNRSHPLPLIAPMEAGSTFV